jgi:hypothetical protein
MTDAMIHYKQQGIAGMKYQSDLQDVSERSSDGRDMGRPD